MEKIEIPKVPNAHLSFFWYSVHYYWLKNTTEPTVPDLTNMLKSSILAEMAEDINKHIKKGSKKTTIKLPYYKAIVLAESLVKYPQTDNQRHLAEKYKLILLPKLI